MPSGACRPSGISDRLTMAPEGAPLGPRAVEVSTSLRVGVFGDLRLLRGSERLGSGLPPRVASCVVRKEGAWDGPLVAAALSGLFPSVGQYAHRTGEHE